MGRKVPIVKASHLTGAQFKRRSVLGAGLSALTLSGLLSGCNRAPGKLLRAAEILPEDFPTSQAVLDMGRRMAEYSDGQLNVKLYAGAQLGSERDALELATFGGVDLARVALAPVNSIEPMTLIPALPFVFQDIPHMRRAMDGAPGQMVLDSLRPHGLVGLCFYDSGARSFYNSKRPINTPADLEGLKVRVQNSDLYVSLIEALGGNATPMPLGEVYQAIVQGVIDGAENNWPSYQDGGHYEVAKYYSLTQHVIAPEILVMSREVWDGMSTRHQDIIIRSARESVPDMRTAWDKRVEDARKIVMDSGVTINEVPDKQPFIDAVQPVWKQYVTSPEQRKLLAGIQDLAPAKNTIAEGAE